MRLSRRLNFVRYYFWCFIRYVLTLLRREFRDRRYWGDEMSSCLEIYCFKYLHTRYYLKCLTEYCPDAILVIPTRRDLDAAAAANAAPPAQMLKNYPSNSFFAPDISSSPQDFSSSSNIRQMSSERPFVIVCPSSTFPKYCTAHYCYLLPNQSQPGNDAVKPKLDVTSTVCMETECASSNGVALQVCVIQRCC